MLEHRRVLMVVDPDEERFPDLGPTLYARDAYDVSVVTELAVASARASDVGASVEVENMLATS